MKLLVANLGSTSYKYRLFVQEDGELRDVANGGFERVTDFEAVIREGLEQLHNGGFISSNAEIDAVGFKTVLGGNGVSGCRIVDQEVEDALEAGAALAPAHNPAYLTGIRKFREVLPEAQLVALFETSFYQWVDEAAKRYAIPESWREAGVVRHGFHGASHKSVAERSAELLGRNDVLTRVRGLYHQDTPSPVHGPSLRVVSCHLGGSSSITGIRDGVAIGTSMGMSPQSGLPQNNRCGDLDPMATPHVVKQLGISLEEALFQLNTQSGLLGISGVSNDLRDIKKAADDGNTRAQLAIDHLVQQIRHWVGSFFFQLGGADAIVFTGGIGEHNPWLRSAVCAGLESLGICLDPETNRNCIGSPGCVSHPDASVKVLVLPAQEEEIVAAETCRALQNLSAQPALT